ncbi:unnamed protein product, partial [Ectocarpus sp. 12 AP-2014]
KRTRQRDGGSVEGQGGNGGATDSRGGDVPNVVVVGGGGGGCGSSMAGGPELGLPSSAAAVNSGEAEGPSVDREGPPDRQPRPPPPLPGREKQKQDLERRIIVLQKSLLASESLSNNLFVFIKKRSP